MYAEKLTEEQIREIMNLISDDGSVRIVQIRAYNSSFEDCVNWSKVPEVKAMFQETEETYRLHDYHIQGFHRAGAGSEYIYRKKMLEYFGDQYAIDFLAEPTQEELDGPTIAAVAETNPDLAAKLRSAKATAAEARDAMHDARTARHAAIKGIHDARAAARREEKHDE